MKMRFHCDHCDTAHATADACGKCERACAQRMTDLVSILRAKGCCAVCGIHSSARDTSYPLVVCGHGDPDAGCGRGIYSCFDCAGTPRAKELRDVFEQLHLCQPMQPM